VQTQAPHTSTQAAQQQPAPPSVSTALYSSAAETKNRLPPIATCSQSNQGQPRPTAFPKELLKMRRDQQQQQQHVWCKPQAQPAAAISDHTSPCCCTHPAVCIHSLTARGQHTARIVSARGEQGAHRQVGTQPRVLADQMTVKPPRKAPHTAARRSLAHWFSLSPLLLQ